MIIAADDQHPLSLQRHNQHTTDNLALNKIIDSGDESDILNNMRNSSAPGGGGGGTGHHQNKSNNHVTLPHHHNQQSNQTNIDCYVPLLLPEDPTAENDQYDDEHDIVVFPSYPLDRHKTILAMCLMFCCGCFNGLVAAFINDLVPRTPLPDLVFQFVPEQKWAWQVSDTLTMCMSLAHVCLTLMHKHRWIMARRFCIISSQLYLLRGVCMAVTWMAVPGQYHMSRCVAPAPAADYWTTVASRVSQFMLSLGLSVGANGEQILCGDLLFSGHTMILVITWYSIDIHLPLAKCRFIRLLAGLIAVCGMIAIIACRMHYTVDVILAFVITTVYFFTYYMYLLNLRQHRFWRRYATMAFWLLPLADYFERNVPRSKLPRVLEWPFERPTFVRQFVKSLN